MDEVGIGEQNASFDEVFEVGVDGGSNACVQSHPLACEDVYVVAYLCGWWWRWVCGWWWLSWLRVVGMVGGCVEWLDGVYCG